MQCTCKCYVYIPETSFYTVAGLSSNECIAIYIYVCTYVCACGYIHVRYVRSFVCVYVYTYEPITYLCG